MADVTIDTIIDYEIIEDVYIQTELQWEQQARVDPIVNNKKITPKAENRSAVLIG